MATLLTALQVVMVILAALPELIRTVEAIHAGAPGQDKKALVMQLVGDVLNQLTATLGVKIPISMVLNVVSGAVDAFVNVFNVVGTFSKKPAAQVGG